jgi:hypothetical protein
MMPVGSTYALSLASLSGSSAGGTFTAARTLGSISGTCQNNATTTYGSSFVNPTDTVTLALNDGSDSVSETVLYVTTFHKGAENEIITSGPTEIDGDSANAVWVGTVVNNNDHAEPVSVPFPAVPLSYTTTLTTSPSSDQAVEALSYFYNMQPLGVTCTKNYSVLGSVMLQPRQSADIMAYVPIDDESGTCDIYGTNGFLGTGTFDAHVPGPNAQFYAKLLN